MRAFVTVGTTRFDELINEVLSESSLRALSSLGVTSLELQIGSGEFDDGTYHRVFDRKKSDEASAQILIDAVPLSVSYYRYKPSIQADMEKADLVIGHAGAGTILECLRLRKPLLVVINERLMDNHQIELAEAMSDGGHLSFCVPSEVGVALGKPRLLRPVTFVPPDMSKVARFIDSRMGIDSTQ